MAQLEFTTGLRDPNHVDPVTPIDALYSDGSNFSEVTPEAEPTLVKAVASAEEVRVYRINPNRKRFHILTEPSWTPETDTFCQTHSDVTGCLVERHDAVSCRVFQPTNPPQRPTDPPISDRVKVVADAIGVLAIAATSWVAYVVMGVPA